MPLSTAAIVSKNRLAFDRIVCFAQSLVMALLKRMAMMLSYNVIEESSKSQIDSTINE
jgi:hypothetical protein